MLPFLFILTSSVWETKYIGEPYLSRLSGPDLLISTKDGFLALISEETGDVLWTQILEKVLAIDIVGDFVIAGDKYYVFLIDKDTGIILYQLHHYSNKITEITFGTNDTIFIRNSTHLAAYQNEKIIWSHQMTNEVKGLHFTENETLICSTNEFNATTGAILGDSSYTYEPVELHYIPTLISYYKDGKEAWCIREPLYKATLLASLSSSKIILTNSTHLLVFDLIHEKVIFSLETVIYSYSRIVEGFVFQNSEGVFILNPKGATLSKYEGKYRVGTYQNGTLRVNNNEVIMPSQCVQVCSSFNVNGGILVSECDNRLEIVVVNPKGNINTLAHSKKVELGTCWTYGESAMVSYHRETDKKNYINSFSLTSNSQRSFETTSLVVAAGSTHYIMDNGNCETFVPSDMNSTIPLTSGTYKPQLVGTRVQGSFNGIKKVVDSFGCVVFQNINGKMFVLQGAISDDTQIDFLVMGIALLLAILMYVTSFNSKQKKFWK